MRRQGWGNLASGWLALSDVAALVCHANESALAEAHGTRQQTNKQTDERQGKKQANKQIN